MARYDIPFVFAGRRDDSPHFAQPALTTKRAHNVRARSREGRLTGSQRPGLRKFNSSVIGAGKVRALISTAIDDRKLAYTFSGGSESILWASATPSKSNCLGGVLDQRGNVYALDGNAGIVKYNSAGAEVMKIALPVADPAHVVRALHVDEGGRIFAGVSAGGDVRTARVFMVLQLEDSQYTVVWMLEPGAYTEELKVYRGSQLYCAHNYTTKRRAAIVVYENLGLEPHEVRRIESLAYPLNGMDLSEAGELYSASGPLDPTSTSIYVSFNLVRPGPPAYFTQPLVGWTPKDDTTIKVWSWFDASDPNSLGEEDVEDASLEDGKQVLRWRDKSGNGRDWFAGSLIDPGEKGPEYLVSGLGGLPCIRFDNGRVAASTKHSLVSLPNASIDVNLADQQRTPIPAYTTSMWCMFLVLRPSPDLDVVPIPRTILALDNEVVGSSDHVLFHNRNAQVGPTPGAATAGFISYFADTDATGDGGAGAGGQSRGFDFLSASNAQHLTGAVLVTIMWDGGIEPNDTTKTRCVVKYNGQIVDRFEGEGFATLKEMWLGYAPTSVVASGTDPLRRFRGEIAEMIVVERRDRNTLTEPKVLTHDQLEPGVAPNSAQTDNQLTRIEGYLAYKWGIGTAMVTSDPALTDLRLTHPYGRNTSGKLRGPPKPIVGGQFGAHERLLLPDGVISKHDAHGVLRWSRSSDSVGGAEGGYGYGVRARKIASDGKTHVWSTGPVDGISTGAGTIAVRKLIDTGDAESALSADGAWLRTFTGTRSPDYAYLRMAADEFGNLYYPYFETGAAAEWSLLVFKKDPDGGGLAQVLVDFLLSASQQAHAVALPPDALNPDYRTDLSTKLAERVYIFTRNESAAANATVHALKLVTATPQATGTARTIHTLAVLEDDIRKITASTNAIPSGGTAVIDATAQYLKALRAGDDIVFLDGVRYMAYNLRDGTISELKSTSAGEIPPRGKLAMYWRFRLFIGCFADAPGNYAASRLGNIRDWNLEPGSLPTGERLHTSTQSFNGTDTRAGEAEDSITALIPAWDDLAFVGCESRILRLTGDPQDNGTIHKVTDSMGIAWDAWCKDQSGRVFVFGNSPPGLYQLLSEGDPLPLSRHTLEESEFAAINFSTHRMVLAWNPIQRGVHIWQVAWSTDTVVDHWFWEEKTHEAVRQPPLWTDTIGLAGLHPTCYTYLGGDDTRELLVGCADGYVRAVDDEADDDDGTAIASDVLFGPINRQRGPDAEWRMREAQVVLNSRLGGCRLELYGSETAEDPGPPVAVKQIGPGLNNAFRARVKAPHLWLGLRDVSRGSWSFESLAVEMEAVTKLQASSERG